ncbi:MAG: phage Gp37/Gp68 family protein [Pseudomonadota bacterium]
MADSSTIEWTDATWNPVTGCTKITAGCDNCYAERFAERFRGTSGHPFENGFDLQLRPERLRQPLAWRRARMIFVNSMSDLFHKEVPFSFVDQVFDTMEEADWHTYQILTKRSSRMRDYLRNRYNAGPAPAHIWCGVSVENAASAARVRHLAEAPASIRFLSIEPLIGPVGDLDLNDISWVIVGGESGPRARLIEADWVRAVRDACLRQDVAFFFKQWGGPRPKSGGRELDGREWSEFPQPLRSVNIAAE